MKLIEIFKNRKLFLLNIFLTLYVGSNLIGGDRGLISYFKKKNFEQTLVNKDFELSKELKELENKNKLLSQNIDLDYLETLYRDKLKFGKKDEIIIRLK